jgi:hypothetical protein
MRKETTTVYHIKKIEGECMKISKENVQVWTKLIEDPKMKAIEANLRETKEQA